MSLDAAGQGPALRLINKARRVLTAGPRRDKDEEKETDDYSDGTAKLAMKALRLSGLFHVVPSP